MKIRQFSLNSFFKTILIKSYKRYISLLIAIIALATFSCSNKNRKRTFDFNSTNDRIWVGEDFWNIPLENWQVKNGRMECDGIAINAILNRINQDIQ